jgi:uncharacterized NAD(P)/FAD-binding protein YdhS
MNQSSQRKRIAIIGGGPGCLFVIKNLMGLITRFEIEVFEKNDQIGAGMPYSSAGAGKEHITNVSDNEVTPIVTSVEKWVRTIDGASLEKFGINPEYFTRYHVLPRLLFGQYLIDQFKLLRQRAKDCGHILKVHTSSEVTDIVDQAAQNLVRIEIKNATWKEFEAVIICTGHRWPKINEGKVPGYFDSPYPPSKLASRLNHPIAIKGSSLTAIDAVRTLARANGAFEIGIDRRLRYVPAPGSERFKIVMHSRNGLLPAIRFHLREPLLNPDSLMTAEQIQQNRDENDGFLSLDFIFEHSFKQSFRKREPAFYKRIKDMTLEIFVDTMMSMREEKEPFELFRKEYEEAERSIQQRKSVFWKEMLAELSYVMNYPAKYLSAEDMLRLQKVLMPLIAVVIAFLPQESCEELFALHDAKKLQVVPVGSQSSVQAQPEGGIIYRYADEQDKRHAIRYQTYIDCSGQPQLTLEDLPFEGLRTRRSVSQAMLKFRSVKEAEKCIERGGEQVFQNGNGDYLLKVPGITINDHFQIVNEYGIANERIYMMAAPYIGGYNPDYSGLDFCEAASRCIAEKLEPETGFSPIFKRY